MCFSQATDRSEYNDPGMRHHSSCLISEERESEVVFFFGATAQSAPGSPRALGF